METAQADVGVLAEIRDILECPVCLTTIWKPPIFRCENDHIFCWDCHSTLHGARQNCPVCRGYLPAQRATIVEQIVSKLVTYKCGNRGCDFLAPLAGQVESHKETCQHRLLDCYICMRRVVFKEMQSHLKDHQYCENVFLGNGPHMMMFMMKRKENPALTCSHIEETESGAKFAFFRFLFKGRYLFWLSHYQGKKETEGFEYTISILCGKKKGQGKTIRLVKHTGLCPPMDMSLKTVEEKQSCLSVTEGFIRDALSKSGHYYCEVTVSAVEQD